MPDEHDDRLVELQERIRARLGELEPLLPGRDGYNEAARAVLDASAELIAFEDRLPRLRDEPLRALSLMVVRWSGRALIGVGALLAVFTLPGWVSRWWLPVIILLMAAGMRMQVVPVEPAGGRHPEQRLGGYLVTVGSVLLLPVPSGLLHGWLAVALGLVAVALLVVGFALVVRPPVTGAHPLTGVSLFGRGR